jgi:ApaG protein
MLNNIYLSGTILSISDCNLKTDIGSMKGSYEMKRIVDGQTFRVNIPEFYLITPFKLN